MRMKSEDHKTLGLRWICATPWFAKDCWRNLATARFDLKKGEQTTQAYENTWFLQLTLPTLLRPGPTGYAPFDSLTCECP
jgi:hypothetical protein